MQDGGLFKPQSCSKTTGNHRLKLQSESKFRIHDFFICPQGNLFLTLSLSHHLQLQEVRYKERHTPPTSFHPLPLPELRFSDRRINLSLYNVGAVLYRLHWRFYLALTGICRPCAQATGSCLLSQRPHPAPSLPLRLLPSLLAKPHDLQGPILSISSTKNVRHHLISHL